VRPLARGGGHPSGTAVAGSLVRSTREHRAGRPRSLAQGAAGSPLDLAPGGVYRAAAVTCGAGGLLHHRFTLTPAGAGAVCFLWHCPAGHPGSALPTTLPCGARTFLTRLAPGATARPTHPYSGYAGCHRARVANRTGAANKASDSIAAVTGAPAIDPAEPSSAPPDDELAPLAVNPQHYPADQALPRQHQHHVAAGAPGPDAPGKTRIPADGEVPLEGPGTGRRAPRGPYEYRAVAAVPGNGKRPAQCPGAA
jgi:hypothetical protein